MCRAAIFILLFLLSICGSVKAGDGGPFFTENKGQWHENVLFKSALMGGYAYIERDGFTVLMLQDNFYDDLHSWVQGKDSTGISNSHVLKFKFLGASPARFEPILGPDIGRSENYFLGSDSSSWSSNVRSYKRAGLKEMYPGISVNYGSNKGNLKYDFIVSSGADPNVIAVEIEGADELLLRDGRLHIISSVGQLTELEPFAYQDEGGKIVAVPCQYSLHGNVVSYLFPEGYDTTKTLIIDPELEFSTFVGSISSNFGFTASYDAEGHLYGGAIVFGSQYPTTAGAAQINYGGGEIDCGITKFSPDGSSLIYSTYIGGSGNEAPHSIVVNSANELYILGSTSSANFPTTSGAYQTTFGGGTAIEPGSYGFVYSGGSDIFITKLTANGQGILNSTFVGGSGNDGIVSDALLEQNYGDRFRGEIVVDAQGAAYVASSSTSANFPTVNGYATNFSGSLTGVIFKISANLSNIVWSTYTGGNNIEAAYGVQLGSDNSVFFTGGTTSNNLPTTAGAVQGNKFLGVDGFVGHLSPAGALIGLTYNGTNGFDQNYFVQIDPDGFVYVIGQTTGNYPVSQGVYNIAGAKQYIHKMNADLTATVWSTVIGAGSSINISPSAFLVSDCGQIYFSGWGGPLNGGSINGLPVSADAYQASTDGSDFYLAVLDTDAQSLEYGTFFGGSTTAEHVDGGTSRFDKNGTVYQAVCAGCGSSDDFPTQPGVWSQTNPSPNCNLGVFKFSLGSVQALAQVQAPAVVCPGTEFTINNLSVGADQFLWDFGDGTTSTETDVTHSYSQPGTYTVTLTAEDAEGCLSPDAVAVSIVVDANPTISIEPVEVICSGDPLQLIATGDAATWQWLQAGLVSNAGISNPFFLGQGSVTLLLVGGNVCGNDTASIDIIVGSTDITITDDTSICPGESITLVAGGGTTYEWSPAETLDNPNAASTVATPGQTTTYSVEITTADGCSSTESVMVSILPPAPILSGINSYVSCNGVPVGLSVTGADTYAWSPGFGLSNPEIANPSANPSQTTTYTVMGSNVCGSDELTVSVIVSEVSVQISADSVVCFKQPFAVSGSGALEYRWLPAHLFSEPRAQTTQAIIDQYTTISLTGINADGCVDTDQFTVVLFPRETVWAGRDRVISFGDQVAMESFSPYPIAWQESPWLSCLLCNNPIANPPETTDFYAEIITSYNCVEVDTATVAVRGNIYVPNSFTPDGDGLNDIFKASGTDIAEFKMEVFNRWGDLIFVSNDIMTGWNGQSNNDDYFSQSGLYPYRIVAKERYGDLFELTGFVMLIR